MAKNNYIRGAGGKFAGSTGGGGFATTGAPKAGGKRAIIARARFRAAVKLVKERREALSNARLDKEPAADIARQRGALLRAVRAARTHRKEVARTEKRGDSPARAPSPAGPGTVLVRKAHPSFGLANRERFAGKRPIYSTRNEQRPKLTPAQRLNAAKYWVRVAHKNKLDARQALATARAKEAASPRNILYKFDTEKAAEKIATRDRAFQNRVKALRRALARAKS